MKKTLLASTLLAASASVNAAELEVSFQLPQFDVENYNKPYVAIWAESKEQNKTLLLWHLKRSKNDKWLSDIRRWWRKIGRYGEAEIDGVTGATKGPGDYKVKLNSGDLSQFKLLFEVVREDGGRSLIKQSVDTSKGPHSLSVSGKQEIGDITIKVTG